MLLINTLNSFIFFFLSLENIQKQRTRKEDVGPVQNIDSVH